MSERSRAVVPSVLVVFGLYQGGVPLIARGIFGADQRFAPAAALDAPWWWLACLAVLVSTGLLAIWLAPAPDAAEDARNAGDVAAPCPVDDPQPDPASGPADRDLDALAGLVVLVGFYNGVAPFVARLVFDRGLLLSLPLHLPAPWWWLVSAAVILGGLIGLAAIERAKQRRHDERG